MFFAKKRTISEQLHPEAKLAHLMKLAGPMIIAHISFTVMQFVDRFMVSRLGTEALAAILPAGIVSFLPSSFAIGVMTSVNTYVSQSLGRGRKQDCSSYCWQAIFMGFTYAVIVVSILWPSARLIFNLIGPDDPVVIEMQVEYLRIILFGVTIIVGTWATSQFYIGIHRPMITMVSALAAQILNVIFNYLLIFGKFGFPKLGIAGAGWGTVIGIAFGVTIRMGIFLSGPIHREYKSRSTMKIDFEKMKDLLRVGLPAGLNLMISLAVWGLILFWQVGRFGKETLAATSAVYSCLNVSVLPVVGLSVALTAAVGKAIGQGLKEVARKQTANCLKIGFIYMGIIGLCFYIFRGPIMHFWAPYDDKVIEAGEVLLIFAAIFQVFDAASIVYTGALRGAGDTLWLAGISALSVVVILGIGGFFVTLYYENLGAVGPWIVATISIMFQGVANYLRFRSNRWMRIDLFKRRPAGIPLEIDTNID